MYERLKFMLKI